MLELSLPKLRFNRKSLVLVLLTAWPLGLTACASEFLNKYRSAPASGASLAPDVKMESKGKTGKAQAQARPGVYVMDQGTYRIQASYDKAWEAMLDVLLRNYNLSIADRTNGLVTTEWDSYYLEGKVHRNKVSLRLKRVASGSELLVYNNVEVLTKLPDGSITEIWLPSDKTRAEVIRLVQNMALALNLAKPEFSEEPLASSPATSGSGPAASL